MTMKKNKLSASGSTIHQKTGMVFNEKSPKIISQLSEEEILKIIFELETRQINLEMVNEELLLTNEKALAALDKYTELYNFAPSGFFTLSKDSKIVELNLRGAEMLGKARSFIINERFDLYVSKDTRQSFITFLNKIFDDKEKKETCELTIYDTYNIPVYVHLTGIVAKNGELCHVTMVDISERRQTEKLQQVNSFILTNLNSSIDFEEAINRLLTIIKQELKFDAVGIRFKKQEDFPYFAYQGFDSEFLLKANCLTAETIKGDVCRDVNGKICLGCICGLVLSEKTDTESSFITEKGSFWTNNTISLINNPHEKELSIYPDNFCIQN